MQTIREEKFKIKASKKIIIGDPMYLEDIKAGKDTGCEKELVLIKKNFPKQMEWECYVREIKNSFDYAGKQVEYFTINILLVGVKAELSDSSKHIIKDMFEKGMYYPHLLKKNGELGCDTARFVIETDNNFCEIHTGADGGYGGYLLYKNDDACRIELNVDADVLSFEDAVTTFKSLFG